MKKTDFQLTLLVGSMLLLAFNTGCTPSGNNKMTTDNKDIINTVSSRPSPPAPVKKQPVTVAEIKNDSLNTVEELSAQKRIQHEADRRMAQQKMMIRKKAEMKSRARAMSKSLLHNPAFSQAIAPMPEYHNVQNNENYAHYEQNKVIQTSLEPVSTFSIDVDTGSYSNVRRLLNSGHLPVHDAIRAEEMINYFSYNYPHNNDQSTPFTVHTEIGPNPWAKGRHLLKVGIKAVDIKQKELPAANLVFLVDVSGSMRSDRKLGLLKKSLNMLVKKMRPQDTIAMVVYAGASGVVLEPTTGSNTFKISQALNSLTAGGSTNGASGIRLAYDLAQQAFIKNGINRILLATDGDFNVGTVNFEQLKNLVEEKRKTGISLSTLGFGTGNYNDHLMEQLADAANGQYSYIDNLNESRKVLVDEMSSSLKTVAKDTKIQIEFNPKNVKEYRLIGYENRKLNKEDFNNDKVDAGDIGAGKTVTALYDIVLNNTAAQIDPLRYQKTYKNTSTLNNELAFVKVRYKENGKENSKLIKHIVSVDDIKTDLASTSKDYQFASSVAAFAEILKGGKYQQRFDFNDIVKLSTASRGDDTFGYRNEFVNLVRLAESLQPVSSNHQPDAKHLSNNQQ